MSRRRHGLTDERMKDALPLREAFEVHSEWHWSAYVQNSHFDWWPSAAKWMWRGEIYRGGIRELIAFMADHNWKGFNGMDLSRWGINEYTHKAEWKP